MALFAASAASISDKPLDFKAAAIPVTVSIYSFEERPAVLYALFALSSAFVCAAISASNSALASSVVLWTLAAYSSSVFPPAPNSVSIPPIDCSSFAPSPIDCLMMAPIAAPARTFFIPLRILAPACLPASADSPPMMLASLPLMPFADGSICTNARPIVVPLSAIVFSPLYLVQKCFASTFKIIYAIKLLRIRVFFLVPDLRYEIWF